MIVALFALFFICSLLPEFVGAVRGVLLRKTLLRLLSSTASFVVCLAVLDWDDPVTVLDF